MFLEFDEQAKKQLEPYLHKKNKLLLSLDDGIGLYSNKRVSCSLDIHFCFIVVDEDAYLEDYDECISSNIGKIFIKPYSKEYLDKDNKVKTGSINNLILTGIYSGVIDANVCIKEYINKKDV